MRDYRIMAMMKRAKKCVLAGALAAALSAAAFAVYAEDAPAPDAPDFSQMCRQLETLLEEENTAVSFNAAAVQAAPGYHPAAPAGESSDAAEGEEQPQGPDRDRFMADIKNAYNARLSVLHRYESFPTMKQDTYDTFRFLCVEAERPFYEAYADAKFENKNYQSLCDRYIKGLKDQLDAEALWREGGDKKEIEALYYEGYDVRAGAPASCWSCRPSTLAAKRTGWRTRMSWRARCALTRSCRRAWKRIRMCPRISCRACRAALTKTATSAAPRTARRAPTPCLPSATSSWTAAGPRTESRTKSSPGSWENQRNETK